EKRNSSGALQWHNSYTPKNSSSFLPDGFLATHETDQSGNVYGLFDVQDSMLIGTTWYHFSQNVPCLAKYSTSGAVSWVKKTAAQSHTLSSSFTYYTGTIYAYGMALDKNNYVYQSGALGGDSLMFDATPVSTIDSRREFFVSKLNNTVTSGVNEITKAEINHVIYPNPALETFSVKANEKINSVQLIDNGGKTVLQTNEETVNVSGLPSGIYTVRMTGNGFMLTDKIIIIK
ncbi:MAG: T9SS type A sorting domain-containing protein, partial [Bacteroidia bacterium]